MLACVCAADPSTGLQSKRQGLGSNRLNLSSKAWVRNGWIIEESSVMEARMRHVSLSADV